jgi:hypothetical protein
MSGFAADWLALREPADRAARDMDLLTQAAAAAGAVPIVLDLGSGAGAMMRALAPHLPAQQAWRLVDQDRHLLAACTVPPGVAMTPHAMNLLALEDLPLAGVTLVTASALFDLVSEDWMLHLLDRLAASRLPLYAALVYDGAASWDPPHALDARLRRALNEHQSGDKGFGPALGPDASERLVDLAAEHGYRVRRRDSTWRLGPDQAALQIATSEGFAAAALELGAVPGDALADWLAFRRGTALAGRMTVGHQDLLALPGL